MEYPLPGLAILSREMSHTASLLPPNSKEQRFVFLPDVQRDLTTI